MGMAASFHGDDSSPARSALTAKFDDLGKLKEHVALWQALGAGRCDGLVSGDQVCYGCVNSGKG